MIVKRFIKLVTSTNLQYELQTKNNKRATIRPIIDKVETKPSEAEQHNTTSIFGDGRNEPIYFPRALDCKITAKS